MSRAVTQGELGLAAAAVAAPWKRRAPQQIRHGQGGPKTP